VYVYVYVYISHTLYRSRQHSGLDNSATAGGVVKEV
jgi:hypothetical protein